MSGSPRAGKRALATLGSTRSLANSISKGLDGKDIILLSGELGAGKTTFVRYLAGAMGIDPAWVSSPSFTIVQKYPPGPEGFGLVHVDLYRVGSESELRGLGMDELLCSADVVAVEWPELLEKEAAFGGRRVWRIEFGSGPDGRRFAILTPP